jgi:hypothetical protein
MTMLSGKWNWIHSKQYKLSNRRNPTLVNDTIINPTFLYGESSHNYYNTINLYGQLYYFTIKKKPWLE